jgi:hypothetical protein
MISYLKVILNPDDSVSLLRVINTPARGIGKSTIETIERLALETGLSLWGAIGEAIQRQLLSARALSAMKSFHDLIEDGSAMLAGAYADRLQESSGEESSAGAPPAVERAPPPAHSPAPKQYDFFNKSTRKMFRPKPLPALGRLWFPIASPQTGSEAVPCVDPGSEKKQPSACCSHLEYWIEFGVSAIRKKFV